jgi:hypothetical protein
MPNALIVIVIRHKGKIPKRRIWASFFQKRIRMPSARFTPDKISSYWGSIGRLGELILMLENLRKWNFHVMGSLRVLYLFFPLCLSLFPPLYLWYPLIFSFGISSFLFFYLYPTPLLLLIRCTCIYLSLLFPFLGRFPYLALSFPLFLSLPISLTCLPLSFPLSPLLHCSLALP